MDQTLLSVFVRSAILSALGLLLIASTPWLLRRVQARWLHAAWLAIALLLIVPFTFPTRERGIIALPPPASADETMLDRVPASLLPIAPGNATRENAFAALATRLDMRALWWALYLAGVAVSLGMAAHRHMRFLRRVRRWSMASPIEDLFHDECRRAGVHRLALRESAAVTGPVLVGLLRPTIYLPEGIHCDERDMRMMLRHEIAHLRRGDIAAKYGMRLAHALHWFNPLLLWFRRAESMSAELSADADMLAGLGSDDRMRYTEAMLRALRWQRAYGSALTTQFWGGKTMMKRRIDAILDERRKPHGVAVLVAVVMLAVMAFAGCSFESKAQIDERQGTPSAENANARETPRDEPTPPATSGGEDPTPSQAEAQPPVPTPHLDDMFAVHVQWDPDNPMVSNALITYTEGYYDQMVASGDAYARDQLNITREEPEALRMFSDAIEATLASLHLTGDEAIDSEAARPIYERTIGASATEPVESVYALVYDALRAQADGQAVIDAFEKRQDMVVACVAYVAQAKGLRGHIAAAMMRVHMQGKELKVAAGAGENPKLDYSEFLYMQDVHHGWMKREGLTV